MFKTIVAVWKRLCGHPKPKTLDVWMNKSEVAAALPAEIRTKNGVPRRHIGGVSKKFKRMAELYKFFADGMSSKLDFSDEALVSLYNHESHGTCLSPMAMQLVNSI